MLAAPEGVEAAVVARELSAAEVAAGREAVEADLFESIAGDLVGEGFFRREGALLVP